MFIFICSLAGGLALLPRNARVCVFVCVFRPTFAISYRTLHHCGCCAVRILRKKIMCVFVCNNTNPQRKDQFRMLTQN